MKGQDQCDLGLKQLILGNDSEVIRELSVAPSRTEALIPLCTAKAHRKQAASPAGLTGEMQQLPVTNN